MYLYVFHQYTYGIKHNCKVGVSKNPEKRKLNYRCGGFEFYKKYLMPDRKSAFAFEAFICRNFPKYEGKEVLQATAEEVCSFIEENYLLWSGQV